MARKADPNSVRQRAFKLLDKLTEVKREDALVVLQSRFKIGETYAKTLYASHRSINQESGVMIKVFTVRDIREGKAVDPYMKVINTFNPTAKDSLTPEDAKEEYRLQLAGKNVLNSAL